MSQFLKAQKLEELIYPQNKWQSNLGEKKDTTLKTFSEQAQDINLTDLILNLC